MDDLFERAVAALERAERTRRTTASLLDWASAYRSLWHLRRDSLVLQQRINEITRDAGILDEEVQLAQLSVSQLRRELKLLMRPD